MIYLNRLIMARTVSSEIPSVLTGTIPEDELPETELLPIACTIPIGGSVPEDSVRETGSKPEEVCG
jgi:hypothetical protein